MAVKKILLIKHNTTGPTFKIPVKADKVLKDGKPPALPPVQPIDHDEWIDHQQMFESNNPHEL